MKISVLGTGMVGRAVSARLSEPGHDVAIGTRSPEETLSRTEPDATQGLPPTMLIANDDSLAEQIQRAHPDARVVKTLSTVFCEVMVNPSRVPGAHNVFVAGDDESAKATATTLLHESGWPAESVLDLGGIEAARAVELYMPLYFTLNGVLGTFDFNISVVRAS